MKINKKQLLLSIVSLVILVAGLVVLILQYAIPFGFMTHPLLNLVFIYALGFGVMTFVLGITYKTPWFFFIAATLLGLAIIYIFMQFAFWWIGLIVMFVFYAIIAIFSFMTTGNKTESIALNKSPEYKNYEQRKAEKQAKEAEEEKPELPEIKSFKD